MQEKENVRIQNFILDGEPSEDRGDKKEKKPAVKKNSAEYSVHFNDGINFIIRRKTKKTDRYLVFIVEEDQYYIKDENENIEIAKTENIINFLKDLPKDGIELKSSKWLERFVKNKTFISDILKVVKDPICKHAILRNMVYIGSEDVENVWPRYFHREEIFEENYELILNMLQKVIDNIPGIKDYEIKKAIFFYITGNSYHRLKQIITSELFTLFMAHSNLKTLMKVLPEEELINTFETFLNEFHFSESNRFYTPTINLEGIFLRYDNDEVKNVIEYIKNTAKNEGLQLSTMIQELSYIFGLEENLFGEIREKYPKNIVSKRMMLKHEWEYIQGLQYEYDNRKSVLEKVAENIKKKEKDGVTYEPVRSGEEIAEIIHISKKFISNYINLYAAGKVEVYKTIENGKITGGLVTDNEGLEIEYRAEDAE